MGCGWERFFVCFDFDVGWWVDCDVFFGFNCFVWLCEFGLGEGVFCICGWGIVFVWCWVGEVWEIECFEGFSCGYVWYYFLMIIIVIRDDWVGLDWMWWV